MVNAESPELRRYFLTSGIPHLLITNKYARAVLLLDYSYGRPDDPDVDPGLFPQFARSIVRSLRICPSDEAARIDRRKLATFLTSIYEIEPIAAALRVVLDHKEPETDDLVKELLETEDWVARFALSQVLAGRYLEDEDPERLAAISKLCEHTNLNHRELGAYALKNIYVRRPDLIAHSSLNHMVQIDRSIAEDLLIELLVLQIGQSEPKYTGLHREISTLDFWNPIWDLNRQNIAFIQAGELFVMEQPLPSNASEWVEEEYEELVRVAELRRALLASPEDSYHPEIRELVQAFYTLSTDVRRIHAARGSFLETRLLRDLLRLFFCHPLWDVIEAVSSVIALVAEQEPNVLLLIDDFIDDSEELECYGAIETAFAASSVDNGQTCTKAIAKFYDSDDCDVRALCAENVTAWILDPSTTNPGEVIQRFLPQIRHWLVDDDCSVLEHIHRLFSGLAKAGHDVATLVEDLHPSLLEDSETATPWYELSRGQFFRHIELAKRRSLDA